MGQIATYLLTYGGAAVALVSPFYGLLAYVCMAIIKPDCLWPWSVPPGSYSRIVGIAMLIGWSLKGFGEWRLGRAWPAVAALVGYLGWSLVSTLVIAPNTEVSWAFVEHLAKIVLPVLIGVTTIDSMRKVRLLAWVILLSETYLAWEFNRWYLEGYNRLLLDGYGSMDNNCNAIALATAIGLAFFLALRSRTLWERGLAILSAVLIAHAILISFSRGGMLGLGAVGLVSFLLIPKKPTYYVAMVVAVALVLRMAGPEVRHEFMTIFADKEQRDDSADSRIQLWRACLQSMATHPAGIGPDHWPLVAHEYGFEYGKQAHTLWLQVGAELGIPGLALLVGYYGFCGARLWPTARGRVIGADPWFETMACAVIASLVGFAVSAQFVSLKMLEMPYYVALVGLAVLRLIDASDSRPRSAVIRPMFFAGYSPDNFPRSVRDR